MSIRAKRPEHVAGRPKSLNLPASCAPCCTRQRPPDACAAPQHVSVVLSITATAPLPTRCCTPRDADAASRARRQPSCSAALMVWCPPPHSHLSSVEGPFVSAIVSATITSSLIEDDESHPLPLACPGTCRAAQLFTALHSSAQLRALCSSRACQGGGRHSRYAHPSSTCRHLHRLHRLHLHRLHFHRHHRLRLHRLRLHRLHRLRLHRLRLGC